MTRAGAPDADGPATWAARAEDDAARRLADVLEAALPQTQCTRCGFPDCRAYAEAMAREGAPIDRCPPGGVEGIARLARLTGRPVVPLDPAHGVEAPRRLAVIEEAACIGCTLCLKACPVDCIVGGPKAMHTVIETECTGCELCIPACPVDCIALVDASGGRTGWDAWSATQAASARTRYRARRMRLAAAAVAALPVAAATPTPATAGTGDAKQAAIAAALARARARRPR